MVSDFGIAKVLDGSAPLTRSTEIMGTIAYLAPEQRFNTKRVDRRADVYALGTIFYEMIMGFPPLGKFPWPRETQDGFPLGIQAILERCLAINPEDRYPDAGALASELDKTRQHAAEGKIATKKGSPAKRTDDRTRQDHAPQADRIEQWFQVLRSGTTRERLAVVREMVEKIDAREAKAIVKLYPGEEDRVRWGLIRVIGELRICAATPLIIGELKKPFHRECAIEALGKIGSDEGFIPLREYVTENPDSALIALLPLARTGKQRSIKCLQKYLTHEMAILRQAAVRALACVATPECLEILKDHLTREQDDKVRSTIQQTIQALENVLLPSIEKIRQDLRIVTKARPA